MAAILGMRGTGSWDSDSRPKNYRQTILLLNPNANLPLTAILSMLPDESTDDPEFKIFTKSLPSQRVVVSGSQTDSDTTIELTGSTPAKAVKKGSVLINERTLEVVWCTADPSGAYTSIEVARGKGSSAAAMNNADGLLIIGSSYAEGSARASAIAYDPSLTTNYTQIFKTALDVTGTAAEMKLRTGDVLTEEQREKLELHGIEMEKAFLFGTGVEDTSGAQPQRTTKGVLAMLSSNIKDFAEEVTIDDWEVLLEDIFENGSNERLCMAGNRAITVLNRIARDHGEIQITPESSTYGMDISTYKTPFGRLQIKQHPLLSQNATFQDWGFITDPKYAKYRYMKNRDTKYQEDVHNPGDDAKVDQWLTESGLELQHESVHAVFKNASAFVA
jgi:Family of unknown function (DUF5309)